MFTLFRMSNYQWLIYSGSELVCVMLTQLNLGLRSPTAHLSCACSRTYRCQSAIVPPQGKWCNPTCIPDSPWGHRAQPYRANRPNRRSSQFDLWRWHWADVHLCHMSVAVAFGQARERTLIVFEVVSECRPLFTSHPSISSSTPA